MTEPQPSRIAEAKRRALAVKQKLGVAAAAAFVASALSRGRATPGRRPRHPRAGSTAANQSTSDENDSSLEGDDFGGFDSFGSIAPSGGATPQVQTHVS